MNQIKWIVLLFCFVVSNVFADKLDITVDQKKLYCLIGYQGLFPMGRLSLLVVERQRNGPYYWNSLPRDWLEMAGQSYY